MNNYKIMDSDGNEKWVKSDLSKNEFLEYIAGKDLYLINHRELGLASIKKRPIDNRELIIFLRELALMIESGISIIEALSIFIGSTSNDFFKDILNSVRQDIIKGNDISYAFKDYEKYFPDIFIKSLGLGQASGELSRILKEVADHLEIEENLKDEIQKALIYPSILLILTIISTIFMGRFVIPSFRNLFAENSLELPFITRMILGTNHFFERFRYLILLALAILAYIIIRKMDSIKKDPKVNAYIIKMPFIGEFVRVYNVFKISSFTNILVKSGLPLHKSLEYVGASISNTVYRGEIEEVLRELSKGNWISDYIKNNKLFPNVFYIYMRVGEQTGKIGEGFYRSTLYFEKKLQDNLDRLVEYMEPITMIIAGLLIGTLLIGMVMPIFKMIGSVN